MGLEYATLLISFSENNKKRREGVFGVLGWEEESNHGRRH